MRIQTKALLLLTAALTLSPALAQAESRGVQESRFINGTVGAVAGALIGGPIGLIAGAAIGYTVGPEIAGPQATFGPHRGTRVRHARRRTRHGRSTRIVIDCAIAANQEIPACVQRLARQQPVYAQQPIYPQQVVYPQPGYPQQPVYMAPAQSGYTPLPARQPAAYAPQMQQGYNPRQNPLVPPPGMFGGGAEYSAALSGPNAPGQQGASGGYGGSYTQQAPAGYPAQYPPQVRAAPVPMPR